MKSMIFGVLKILLAVFFVVVLAGYLVVRTDRSVDGLNRYDTEHFAIYYQELKPSTLADMEDVLEGRFQVIEDFFKIYTDKTDIIVYASVGQFQRKAYGLAIAWGLEEWAVGGADEDKIFMASPENPGSMHDYQGMLEVLTHEYVHTQVWRLNPDVDIWINEGLAVYFAQQQRRIDREIPSFEAMQSQDSSDFANAEGYLFGYYYAEFLIETFGADSVVELIKTGSFEGALGKSKREVYDVWVETLTPAPVSAS